MLKFWSFLGLMNKLYLNQPSVDIKFYCRTGLSIIAMLPPNGFGWVAVWEDHSHHVHALGTTRPQQQLPDSKWEFGGMTLPGCIGLQSLKLDQVVLHRNLLPRFFNLANELEFELSTHWMQSNQLSQGAHVSFFFSHRIITALQSSKAQRLAVINSV